MSDELFAITRADTQIMELDSLANLRSRDGEKDEALHISDKVNEHISNWIAEHSEVFRGLREVQRKVTSTFDKLPLLLEKI